MGFEAEVRELYARLIAGWNAGDADEMTAPLADQALVVGFDGSQMLGRAEAAKELGAVFADHEVAHYVSKVRSVIAVGDDAALLHAIAGMVAPGESELMPERNTIQTVVASRQGDGWRVLLFQSTPARFDGRPELVEQMTAELAELLE